MPELSPTDVDTWLTDRAEVLATSTLRRVRSILGQAITQAQARDKVKRNVVGTQSKSLTLEQGEALIQAALSVESPSPLPGSATRLRSARSSS